MPPERGRVPPQAEASVPILVRPVREQLEHDRIIRLLEAKYRRKFRVEINPGDERTASLKVGALTLFPDLILTDDSGRKPYAVVEVETSESVNHLEAMSQWANLAKSRAYLYLYVPAGSVETARRLCADHQIELTELVTYLGIGDQVRFTSVFKVPTPDPIPFKTPPPEKKVAVKKPAEPVAEAVEPVAERATEKPDVDKAVAAKPAPVKGIEKPAAKIATKVAAKAPAKKEAVEKKAAPPAKVAASAKPVGPAAKSVAPAKAPVKAPAPARPVAPAAAKRRATEPPRRAAAPASKHAAPAKRAAASRTTTRAATKRTPPRAANHRPAVKAKPAQKRK